MDLQLEGLRDNHHLHHHPQLRHHDARREARQRRQGHPLRTIGKDLFGFEYILRLFRDPQREITQSYGQERAVTWRGGFVNNFLRVPLAFLGSRTAAVQLWNSQKIVYKKSSPSNSPAW